MSSATEQRNNPLSRFGYQSAIGVGIVTAVFSVFIAVLLGVNVYHRNTTEPALSAELEKMKEQAKAYPADQTLAREIQTLDTQLRRDQFARLYFLERGTILLIVTLVFFTGSILWAQSHRFGRPRISPQGDLKVQQVQHASRTRVALTGGFVVLCAGALFWVMHAPQIPDEPTYTSMDAIQSQWPSFRGPGGLGVAEFEKIPDTWDGSTGENILWKAPIPLGGHNSPIRWDSRLFLTGATEDKQQVYCYDADTGELLWQRDVSIPSQSIRKEMDIMPETGYAANTAVTDGKRVCAIFAGGDVGCFTVEGQGLWEKHFGVPESMYGYAASLTWFENLVIVQWDVGDEGENSKLIAVDWQTGQTMWETPRPAPNSWASPTVVEINGQYRILTNASPFTIVYDAKTGTELYRVDCVYGDIAATPILASGKIFAIEPYNKLVAINTDESLQPDETRIAWENNSEMPDICSPVSNGQTIWTLTTPGNLSCFKVTDGERLYRQSTKLNFQASPTLAGQTLYLLSEKGTMLLLDAGPEYKEIKRNELGEACFASPAFGDGRIYIRGEKNLYAIGND